MHETVKVYYYAVKRRRLWHIKESNLLEERDVAFAHMALILAVTNPA